MKVYVLTELGCIDYTTTLTTKVFSNKEDAVKEMMKRGDNAKTIAEDVISDDERIVEISDNSYDVYMDGNASLWEVNITISEEEVI